MKSAQETLRVYVKRAECLDIPLREQRVEMKCALEGIHFENLALAVSSAMRTRDMRGNAAFAFRACLELRCAPAVSSATHLLLHFGCSALGYCHGISRLRLFEWLIESLFFRYLRARLNSKKTNLRVHPEHPKGLVLRLGGASLPHQ